MMLQRCVHILVVVLKCSYIIELFPYGRDKAFTEQVSTFFFTVAKMSALQLHFLFSKLTEVVGILKLVCIYST